MTSLTTPDQIQHFHMTTQLKALKLEIRGLKFSRGSVYAHIKRTYNLKGSKQRVYDQFDALIKETFKEQLHHGE